MSRLVHVRSLLLATPAVIGIALACRAASPGEAPPLAPRPEPIQPNTNPVPSVPDPRLPGPRGPSILLIDARPAPPSTTQAVVRSEFRGESYPMQVPLDGPDVIGVVDATDDAGGYEPMPDSVPVDASIGGFGDGGF